MFWGRLVVSTLMTVSALALSKLGPLAIYVPEVLTLWLAYVLVAWAIRHLNLLRAGWLWDYGQMLADTAWVTIFIHATDGTDNPFPLLYFLAIMSAASVRYARGAIITATLAAACLALLMWSELRTIQSGLVPSAPGGFYSIFRADFVLRGYIYAICFYLVAAFSGFLAERLKAKGRQLEDTARALEEFRLSTGDILERMGSGLLTLNARGQVMYCNAAGARILGLDPRLVEGQEIGRAAAGGLQPFAEVLSREVERGGGSSGRWEVKIGLGRDSEIPVGISTTAITDGQGNPEGLIAIFQDLSAAKSMENRLIEIEQLETSQQLTKNLLKAIHPYLAEIEKGLGGLQRDDDPDSVGLISGLRRKAGYIRKTVEDFARFAHIEVPMGDRPVANPPEGESRIIGQAPNFIEVLNMVRQVAPTDSTVLVCGESGTGKELLARELHRLSNRNRGPFVSINCAAIPETLLESELFGHLRGSFTGAVRDKEGLFRLADGGTFFLDEVSETSPAIQVKLLRVLQEREIVPVGGSRPIKVDVRVISATNQDLAKLVEQNRFRTDLFYRLNVIQITIPPLRDRGSDIMLLAERIVENVCRRQGLPVKVISSGAREALQQYPWPGNVRELENVLERAVILEDGAVIGRHSLPDEVIKAQATDESRPKANKVGNLKESEKQTIIRVLDECGGNKSKAAKKLGIHYATLYRKLKGYKIE